MNVIRKSVSLFSKNKLFLNNRKLKRFETKVLSNVSFKKNKLIKSNSIYSGKSRKKSPTIFIKKVKEQLEGIKQKKTKELINNRRRSVAFDSNEKIEKQFRKLLNKKYEEDKYLSYVKNKIYKKISKKYTSPYIFNSEEKKNKLIGSTTYYNYFLMCALFSNKRCKLNSRYNDYLYFYNKQEYLIRYFCKNEIYIIMNYLVYIVYSKDIATIAKHAKKLLTFNEIRNMFNNLINNNFNFIGTMEIMKDIAVYYKHRGNNNPKNEFSNLENIKPVLKEKINYIYAKDIPNDILPNCIPKYYLLEEKILNCIRDFTNKRKYMKISRFDKSNQIGQKIKKKRQYYDSNKIKGNILTNITLFVSRDKFDSDRSLEIKETKRRHNSYRRVKNDYDIDDIEMVVEKILGGLQDKNDKENNNIKYTKKISRKIIRERSKRVYSMIQTPYNRLKQKESFFQSSKSINRKVLNTNELNKKVFKTSLKHVGITTSKNVVRFIKRIHGNNLTLNKDNNIRNNIIIKEEQKNFKNLVNMNDPKNKTVKNRNTMNKNGRKLIRFDGLNKERSNLEQKLLIKSTTNNINSNSFKVKSSNDSLFSHKIKNISKFIDQTNKNKYSINNYFSLKKFHSFSTKNASKPKKVKFNESRKKAFNSYCVMNFEDKDVNIWENNKIDTGIINVAVKTSFLLNKIGNSYKKDIKSIRNCISLKKLIKYPLIYFSNCK